MILAYESREEADEAVKDDEIVCGAFYAADGSPRYFCVKRDISDVAFRMKAYEVRYGREMSAMEEHDLILAMEEKGLL